MNVLDAIRARKSIRAFKSDPVPRAVLNDILEVAQRAPSGTNTQPWHTFVCTGEVQRAISEDVLKMVAAGEGRSYEEYDYYPAKWREPHQSRRRGVGWGLYGLLGIQKGDREAAGKQAARNFKFFDAPVGVFITVENYLTRGSWADAGMYAQTIMLAAKGHGLDTCPQAAWIPFQEPIRRHLGIPEDHEIITGMSLGYMEPDAIENTLVSEREAMENVVRFVGF